jgi:hypothetical protein
MHEAAVWRACQVVKGVGRIEGASGGNVLAMDGLVLRIQPIDATLVHLIVLLEGEGSSE